MSINGATRRSVEDQTVTATLLQLLSEEAMLTARENLKKLLQDMLDLVSNPEVSAEEAKTKSEELQAGTAEYLTKLGEAGDPEEVGVDEPEQTDPGTDSTRVLAASEDGDGTVDDGKDDQLDSATLTNAAMATSGGKNPDNQNAEAGTTEEGLDPKPQAQAV